MAWKERQCAACSFAPSLLLCALHLRIIWNVVWLSGILLEVPVFRLHCARDVWFLSTMQSERREKECAFNYCLDHVLSAQEQWKTGKVNGAYVLLFLLPSQGGKTSQVWCSLGNWISQEFNCQSVPWRFQFPDSIRGWKFIFSDVKLSGEERMVRSRQKECEIQCTHTPHCAKEKRKEFKMDVTEDRESKEDWGPLPLYLNFILSCLSDWSQCRESRVGPESSALNLLRTWKAQKPLVCTHLWLLLIQQKPVGKHIHSHFHASYSYQFILINSTAFPKGAPRMFFPKYLKLSCIWL